MASFSSALSCSSSFSSELPLVFSLWSLLLRAVRAASKYQWNCWHESGAAINPQPLHHFPGLWHNKVEISAAINSMHQLSCCQQGCGCIVISGGCGHHQLHPDQKGHVSARKQDTISSPSGFHAGKQMLSYTHSLCMFPIWQVVHFVSLTGLKWQCKLCISTSWFSTS